MRGLVTQIFIQLEDKESAFMTDIIPPKAMFATIALPQNSVEQTEILCLLDQINQDSLNATLQQVENTLISGGFSSLLYSSHHPYWHHWC